MGLPFTSDQFFDVFAEYNRSFSIAALIWWLGSAAALAGAWRKPRAWSRTLLYLLAALWIWNAVAYHALLFTKINPAAWLFAILFVIQGVLLLQAATPGRVELMCMAGPVSGLGVALACYALAYPLLTLGLGRRYPETPTFGVPCPTAILTIGVLLSVRGEGFPLRLAAIPAIWAVIGGSAAILFGVWTDYVLLAAGVLLIGTTLLWLSRRWRTWNSGRTLRSRTDPAGLL